MNEIRKGYFLILLLVSSVILVSIALLLKMRNNLSTASRNKAALVEDFPQVPIYPKSRLISSENDQSDVGFLYAATWESSDQVPQVSKWYLIELEKNSDWKIITPPADFESKDVQLIVSEKESKIYNFSLIKDSETEKTKIIIQISNIISNDEEDEENE